MINGVGCAVLSALPFLVIGGVGLRNVLRERRTRETAPTYPRYGGRRRVAHVTCDAHGSCGCSEIAVDA